MKRDYFSAYFPGVTAKSLSVFEASRERSHQHEFNGSDELVRSFGTAGLERHNHPARFLYVGEDSDQPVDGDSTVAWCDARATSAARTGRTEHRL
jgi:hypothetical protein